MPGQEVITDETWPGFRFSRVVRMQLVGIGGNIHVRLLRERWV